MSAPLPTDRRAARRSVRLDTERSPAVAARYGVQSIPNFVVLKDGHVVLQRAGLVDAAQLGSWLAAA